MSCHQTVQGLPHEVTVQGLPHEVGTLFGVAIRIPRRGNQLVRCVTH